MSLASDPCPYTHNAFRCKLADLRAEIQRLTNELAAERAKHERMTDRSRDEEHVAALRQLCKGYGGQTRFAVRHGFSVVFISRVLNGAGKPSVRLVKAIEASNDRAGS